MSIASGLRKIKNYFSNNAYEGTYVETFLINIIPKLLAAFAAITMSSAAFLEYCGATTYFKELFPLIGIGTSNCDLAGTIIMASNGYGFAVYFVSRFIMKYIVGKVFAFAWNRLATNWKAPDRVANTVAPSSRQKSWGYLIAAIFVSIIYVSQGTKALAENGDSAKIWGPIYWVYKLFEGLFSHFTSHGTFETMMAILAGSSGGVTVFIICSVYLFPVLLMAYNAAHAYFFPESARPELRTAQEPTDSAGKFLKAEPTETYSLLFKIYRAEGQRPVYELTSAAPASIQLSLLPSTVGSPIHSHANASDLDHAPTPLPFALTQDGEGFAVIPKPS